MLRSTPTDNWLIPCYYSQRVLLSILETARFVKFAPILHGLCMRLASSALIAKGLCSFAQNRRICIRCPALHTLYFVSQVHYSCSKRLAQRSRTPLESWTLADALLQLTCRGFFNGHMLDAHTRQCSTFGRLS
jgi:hypothetical protein